MNSSPHTPSRAAANTLAVPTKSSGQDQKHASPPRPLPRPREHGLLSMLAFARDPIEMPIRYFDRLGDTFRMTLFGTEHLVTRDPAWFDEIQVKHARSFNKDQTTKGLAALMGQGLLVRDGAPWRERRRLLSPPFVPAAIEGQVNIFVEESERELATWSNASTIDLHAAMARLTMRIALRTLFGYEARADEAFEEPMAAAMRYFEGILGSQIPLPTWIPTGTNRAFLRSRRRLNEVILRLLQTHAPKGSVLDVLRAAEERGELTHQDVVDEAMTMLVAGHETSALSLTYLLAELGLNQGLQEAVAREATGYSAVPTLAELTRDDAIRRAVLEGLRLYPVAWATGREVSEPVTIRGHALEVGTQVYLFQWAMQRSERVYPRAGEFRPDRWRERPLSTLPKGAFSPFGGGPRVCIGNQFALAEIATLVVQVLAQFQVETVSPFPPPLRASITARPRDPVLVRVTRRG